MGLFRFLIAVSIFYLAYKFLKNLYRGDRETSGQASQRKPSVQTGEDLVEDSYCHVYIPLSNAFKVSLDGKNLYFCSKTCCEEFLAEKKSGV
jgi:YHS domain-containing protein